MTREEAIEELKAIRSAYSDKKFHEERLMNSEEQALEMAIQALSQEPCRVKNELKVELNELEPCDDAISRKEILKYAEVLRDDNKTGYKAVKTKYIRNLPSVTQKSGKCKNCKYFEYDRVAKVDGIPLIVAHEICNKWGNGCKTSEDGYCYLYEPQESEDKE